MMFLFFLCVLMTCIYPKQDCTLWWHTFPTIGLRLEAPFWPLVYPFLPHAFSLWQLAPQKGKGCSVALLDTGIAAFTGSVGNATYQRHPHLFITGDFVHESFCFLSHDPYQEASELLHYYTCQSPQICKRDAQLLTVAYQVQNDKECLKKYLLLYGKQALKKNVKSLSLEGERAERVLARAFAQFTPFVLEDPPSTGPVFLENLPLITDQFTFTIPENTPSLLFTDHGTHIASIIGARPTQDNPFSGLAPNCSLYMFKTVDPCAEVTDLKGTVLALERIISKAFPIVNLSLSCNKHWDCADPLMKRCEEALQKIPFVCAAVGNDRLYTEKRITYPARCSQVYFSVGAFGCNFNTIKGIYQCFIAPWSQSEKGIGPRYVSPGVQIYGCLYHKKPSFGFRSGSSMATGLVSGFLALLYAEYGDSFSVAQLQALCDASAFRLHNNKEWQEEVIKGVIDMRTVLFAAQVLKRIKKIEGAKTFDKRFTFFLDLLMTILFSLPDKYGIAHNNPYSFRNHFMDYFAVAKKIEKKCWWIDDERFINLEMALSFVTTQLLMKGKEFFLHKEGLS